MIINNLKKRLITSILLFLLIFLIINSNLALIYTLIVLGAVSILEFLNITKKIFKNKIYFIISNLFFIFFIFFYCMMFFLFSNFIQLKLIFYTLLFGCVFSDIGGFVFGKYFKGPKLSNISPNKTISGALGSLIFTSIAILSIIFIFTKNLNINIFFICILTSVACQLGDLFFSFLKRKANLKDTGNLLPGHGGVLDRLDGIFFGLPFGLIIFIFFY